MRRHAYRSAFANDINDFINYKAGLGIKGKSREWYLLKFDEYCAKNNLAAFDKKTVEGWVLDHEENHPCKHRSWMSYIRDFGRYLRLTGKEDAYVLSESFKAKPIRPTPYLFSEAEVGAFLNAAATLHVFSPWAWQAKCFFGLMYALGLRTCEAIRLGLRDVSIDGRYIDIVWSKGNRSRRLYLTGEVAAMLDECNLKTCAYIGSKRETFFVNAVGRPVSSCSVGVCFSRIWKNAGLARPLEGKRPRPYDFRHHFAYRNIERWSAAGVDVNAMIPYLARCMGHSSFDSTYYYIHTSPGFLSSYAKIACKSADILPEVGFDG